MSVLYGEELVNSLHNQWTDKWIKAVLDMNGFLSDDSISSGNIRVLESLMMTIDTQTKDIFCNGGFSIESFSLSSVGNTLTYEEPSSTAFAVNDKNVKN
jgi:hypothetical protein